MERWLSPQEVAQYLGVKRDTVYKWISRKRFPAHKIGRLWKFRKSEVDRWVESQDVHSGRLGLTISESTMREISAVCDHFKVRRLELFGSFTKGKVSKRSDVDFLLEFEPMPPAEHAEAYFGLLEELERIFKRKVDLVELKALKNPYFLKGVRESREVVYG